MDIPAWQAAKRPSQGIAPMTFPQMRLWVSLADKNCLTATGSRRFCTCFPIHQQNYITFLRVFQFFERKWRGKDQRKEDFTFPVLIDIAARL